MPPLREGGRGPGVGRIEPAELAAEGVVEVADDGLVEVDAVEVHVSDILAKLGARSRVEIAREAASHGAAAPTPDRRAAAPDASTA
jgi:hypothetical protein